MAEDNMTTYDEVVALLDELTSDEQLALIAYISNRLRQPASEPVDDEPEELPEEDMQGRRSYPRLREMIEWGVLLPGQDKLYVEGHPEEAALLLDAYNVAYRGEVMSINDWAKGVKGWTSISIYRYVIVAREGRLLNDIRYEYMTEYGIDTD